MSGAWPLAFAYPLAFALALALVVSPGTAAAAAPKVSSPASPPPSSSSSPSSAPDQGRLKTLEISQALRDYCGVLYACKLKIPRGMCPAPLELGPPTAFAPDGERCVEARELQARGLGANHPEFGFRLYRLLGQEYRIAYQIPDTLAISRARLEYLIGDVPLAAKLVSHYRKEPYTAEWVNAARTHFKGAKGEKLRGEAVRVSGGFDEGRLIYIGTGVAEVAFWTLVGPAMMDYRYHGIPATGTTPERVAYDLKVVVFPGNGLINSIMNLGVFRSVVTGKIRDVLTDITETARLLEEDGGKQLLKDSKWTAEEKKKIAELLKME